MLPFALAVFASAFLLFSVQPLLGKYVLPWFGGGSAVWGACLLFFQVGLLAGYAYAHAIVTWLDLRRQILVHLALLAAALLVLPIAPPRSFHPGPTDHPELAILAFLAATIGAPYVVLSATGPLLQSWFAAANRGGSPYRLFAVSNLGSFLPLLAYPSLIEPTMTRTVQARAWSVGFALFGGIVAWAGYRAWTRGEAALPVSSAPLRLHAMWAILPACASIVLLGATRRLTEEVAPIPLLWVAPLAVYLLTFVIAFEWPRLYSRPLFVPLTIAASLVSVRLMEPAGVSIEAQIILHLTVVFVCCLACHGEMQRLRPDPRNLTSYYLMIAAGGAAGSLFFVLVAPRLLDRYVEYELATLSTTVLLGWAIARDKAATFRWGAVVLVVAGSIASGVWLVDRLATDRKDVVCRARSFFGVLRVVRRNAGDPDHAYTRLDHGRIMHGAQIDVPGRRREPTLYFGEISGVGRLLRHPLPHPRRIGVVGLGVGTLAAYGRPGDVFRFYEIDPNVVRIARENFTYLDDSTAESEIVLGDGRRSLEGEPPQSFDALILDAFSGDAVPTHLLTLEAFEGYRRHLAAGGIIAVNVTNVYLDLRRVLIPLAERLGDSVAVIVSPGDPSELITEAAWVLMSRDPSALEAIAGTRPRPAVPRAEPWTDDYASLYPLLITPASRRTSTPPAAPRPRTRPRRRSGSGGGPRFGRGVRSTSSRRSGTRPRP